MPVADFANARKVFWRRNEDAVGADDRLENNGRDIALVADHVLNVVGARDVTARIRVLDRAIETVRLRSKHKAQALAARLHGPTARIASRRDGSVRGPVIGAVARDDLGLARVHARNLEGRLIGLGSAGREEEFIEALGQHFQ